VIEQRGAVMSSELWALAPHTSSERSAPRQPEVLGLYRGYRRGICRAGLQKVPEALQGCTTPWRMA
jgi:hypothetical protein